MSDNERRNEMNESWIETMRAEYNAPPDTPREAMWDEIESRLDEAEVDVIPIHPGGRPERRAGRRPWMGGLAAAAVLVLIGVGLGRMSVQPTPQAGTPVTGEGERLPTTLRTAAYRHLSRSESFLALVRTDARQGELDADIGSLSRGLLLQTRLLMDSPAADDAAIQRILRDLELILVQVAQMEGESPQASGSASGELALLSEALEEQDMIMRIRSVLPAGAAQAGL